MFKLFKKKEKEPEDTGKNILAIFLDASMDKNTISTIKDIENKIATCTDKVLKYNFDYKDYLKGVDDSRHWDDIIAAKEKDKYDKSDEVENMISNVAYYFMLRGYMITRNWESITIDIVSRKHMPFSIDIDSHLRKDIEIPATLSAAEAALNNSYYWKLNSRRNKEVLDIIQNINKKILETKYDTSCDIGTRYFKYGGPVDELTNTLIEYFTIMGYEITCRGTMLSINWSHLRRKV